MRITILLILLFCFQQCKASNADTVLVNKLDTFFKEKKLELIKLFLIENEPNLSGGTNKIKERIDTSDRFELTEQEGNVCNTLLMYKGNELKKFSTKDGKNGKKCSEFKKEFKILEGLSAEGLINQKGFFDLLKNEGVEIKDTQEISKLDSLLSEKYRSISTILKDQECEQAKLALQKARALNNKIEDAEIEALCSTVDSQANSSDGGKCPPCPPKTMEYIFMGISFLSLLLAGLFFWLWWKAKGELKRLESQSGGNIKDPKDSDLTQRTENKIRTLERELEKKNKDLFFAHTEIEGNKKEIQRLKLEAIPIVNQELSSRNSSSPYSSNITVYYSSGTDANFNFSVDDLSKNKEDGDPYYFQIFNIREDFAEFKVIDDPQQQSRAAQSASVILENVCEYINLPTEFKSRIITESNGKLKKEGNLYKIIEKARISFG